MYSANEAISYGKSFRFEIFSDETAASGRNIFFENINELELQFTCSISTKWVKYDFILVYFILRMYAQEAWAPKRFF